jgi:hypothetical protein
MAREILPAIEQEQVDPALRMVALDFFTDNPVREAIPVLARLAGTSKEKGVAGRALWALMNSTGFSIPPDADAIQPIDETGDEEAVPEAQLEPEETAMSLTAEEFGKLPIPERRKVVEDVLDWWREHEEMVPQPRRVERHEALAAPGRSGAR